MHPTLPLVLALLAAPLFGHASAPAPCATADSPSASLLRAGPANGKLLQASNSGRQCPAVSA